MSPLKTWLRKLFPELNSGRRRSLQKKKRQAPVLERLEDRLTPSANTVAFIPHDATIVTAGQVSGLITFKVTDGHGNAVAGEKVDLTSSSGSGLFFAGPGSSTAITSVYTGANGTGSFVYQDAAAGSPALTVSDDATPLVSATEVETVSTVFASSTFGEFPGYGVWRYEAATGWQQTTPVNATALVKDGAGDAFAELPGYGIWKLPAGGGSYQQLTPSNASILASNARGDLVADLPGYGVYELPVNGGWQRLTPVDATALSINDQGQISGVFPGAGVYQMNPGGGWLQISPVNASLVVSNSTATVAEFPGYGVYEITSTTGWQQLTPVNASVLGIDANGDVFGEFPGYGVWELKAETTNWKQSTVSDASTFEVDGQGNLVADFPRYGVWVLNPGAGYVQITTSDSTVLGGLPVTASVANTINFIAPDAATLTSGADSGTITVQVLDQFGNPLAGEQVDLTTSNTATGDFFANAGSTTPIPSVLTGANGTASFVYTDTNGAGADLTARDNGNALVSTTQFETVSSAAAKSISFTSTAQTLTAGVDSATVSVQVLDKFGNPLAGEQVNLSSSDATTGAFYASASSTTPITSVLTGANGIASFVYADTLTGSPILTATDAANLSVTTTQTETVKANSAAKLAITSVAKSTTAGAKSSTITVQVEDQYGNVVAKSGDTVNLTSSSAKGLFYNAAGTLTITNVTTGAAGSATFLYEDTIADTPTIKAADATTTTLTAATQQETINPSTAFQLAFPNSSPPQELTAGEVSNPMVVQVEDQFGNAVNENNDNVNLSTSTNSTGKFYATANTTGTPITFVTTGAGGSATFYYIDTLSGTPTLSAKDTTNTMLTSPTATQVETVSPNVAYKLEFTTAAQIFTAGVAGGNPLTVQVVDQYGNVVTEAGDTVNLSSTSTGAKGGLFYASAGSMTPITSVMTGPSGSVSFYYEDSTLGHPTITASDSNTRLVGPAATQIETVVATTPYQIGFSTTAESQIAGKRSVAITVQVEDQYGNATAENGDTINLSSNAGTGLFYLTPSGGSAITSVTTNASGAATFYYYDTTVGTPMLTATDTNAGLTIKTTHQTETVTQAGASTITFVAPDAMSLTAGTKSGTITVLVKDAFGNVLTNEVVNLATSAAATGLFYNSAGTATITSVTTNASGLASFQYYDTLAGTPTITATDNVNSAVTQTQMETVNPNVAYKLVFTTLPQTLNAGQKSTPMTVEVEDQYGNEVNTADTINLTSSSGNGVFYDSTGTTVITSVNTVGGAGELRLPGHDDRFPDHPCHGHDRGADVQPGVAVRDDQHLGRLQTRLHHDGADDHGREPHHDHHRAGRGPVRQRGGRKR